MAKEKRKLTSFERAFVSARRSGAKEFSFGGKKFNTKRKGEGGGKRTAQASTPKKGGSSALKRSIDKVEKSTGKPLEYKATKEQIASKDKPQTHKKAAPLNAKDIPAGVYGSKQKDAPTPTPKPSTSSGHNFGVVGRVGEIGRRLFSSTSDPKTLFKDKGKTESSVPKPNKIPTPTSRPDTPTPANAPKPTARPASPRERQAKRTEAYLTNVVDAPAVGESTFAKSVHGMENIRSSKPKSPAEPPAKGGAVFGTKTGFGGRRIQKIPNAKGGEGNIQKIPNAPLKPTPPKFTQAAALTKQQRTDSQWNARDAADTRKRMEEAKTPRPGKTGGIPSENRFVRGTVTAGELPRRGTSQAQMTKGGGPKRGVVSTLGVKSQNDSVQRGAVGTVMDGSLNRGTSGKVTAVAGKSGRLPRPNLAKKGGRTRKTTVVAGK